MGLAAAGVPAHAARGRLIHAENFRAGLGRWRGEWERPGRAEAAGGVLDLEAPAGPTLWFRPELRGPVRIDYEAQAVAAGGPHDRVSDLNCFWMATDPRTPDDFFARPRSGAFADYNALLTYYVGLGGNGNTTTRFRRYIGDPVERPLRPEHDLGGPGRLLQPNRWQRISLLADGADIGFYRDRRRLFAFRDPAPYARGHFGLRTTASHLRFRRLRIYQLDGSAG